MKLSFISAFILVAGMLTATDYISDGVVYWHQEIPVVLMAFAAIVTIAACLAPLEIHYCKKTDKV
jgi:hypothetical protein